MFHGGRTANAARQAGALSHNSAMHTRRDFKQRDPAWDEQEAQWMAQMATGQPADAKAAHAQLFMAYNSLFITRLNYHGLSVAEAQDTAQDLWMEIARAAPRYEPGAPVRLYLRGFLGMARRRHFSALKASPPLDSTTDEGVAASVETALQALAWSTSDGGEFFDFARCVRRALSQFTQKHPRLASLLLLRHVEEFSLEEIEQKTGETDDHAKADLFSAREKFRPKVAGCLSLWPNRARGDDEQPR